MENRILIILIAACILIILLGYLKNHGEMIVNIFLRLSMGTVGIYFVNTLLDRCGINIMVGINEISLPILAFLGMPGFLLLYGASIYFFFR